MYAKRTQNGKMDAFGIEKSMMRTSVEILGCHYNEHHILNKCVLEWVGHISNALDCLLQYVNAALNLKISVKSVGKCNIARKLKSYPIILNNANALWKDNVISYIQAVYNYSKHTLTLYGSSSLSDMINGQRDIIIPAFRYKNTDYKSRKFSELTSYYEKFVGMFLSVLDSVKLELQQSQSVPNRYHFGKMVIDGHVLGDSSNESDLILKTEFAEDGEDIKRYWVEDLSFVCLEKIEIM